MLAGRETTAATWSDDPRSSCDESRPGRWFSAAGARWFSAAGALALPGLLRQVDDVNHVRSTRKARPFRFMSRVPHRGRELGPGARRVQRSIGARIGHPAPTVPDRSPLSVARAARAGDCVGCERRAADHRRRTQGGRDDRQLAGFRCRRAQRLAVQPCWRRSAVAVARSAPAPGAALARDHHTGTTRTCGAELSLGSSCRRPGAERLAGRCTPGASRSGAGRSRAVGGPGARARCSPHGR